MCVGGDDDAFPSAMGAVGPQLPAGPPGVASDPELVTSADRTGPSSASNVIERLELSLATTGPASLRPTLGSGDDDQEISSEKTDGISGAPSSASGLKRHSPIAVLVAMTLGYIAVFGTLTYQQQSNFGTFGFDMGIYDQGIWLLSHFKDPFDTIRGLEYFGQNVNVITLLFLPAYWFGAGPHFLYAVQTVWLAAGAIPIWLLGRDRLRSSWLALGLSAAYLLYPSVEWINWWTFRPDALIITPLMFAYWFATRRSWGWFWAALAVTLSCKEDAGLAVLALGICLLIKHRERARGLITAICGLAWFLICTKVVIPFANGGGPPFYVAWFPSLGSNETSILVNLVVHPSRWIGLAISRSRWTYYKQLFFPVALWALLEPLVLLIGVPQLLINVTSSFSYTRSIHFYYTSIVIAAIFLATVEACAKRGRTPARRRVMVALVVVAAVATNVAWSPSPLGSAFHSGIWAQPQPQDTAINEAINMVPKNASVSATYNIDDHMTHRVLIYEYPNPWVLENWGLSSSYRPPDPSKVDWLVLDTRVTGTQSVLYEVLVIDGQFKVVFAQQGILVLHRVEPGIPDDHHWP